MAYSAKILCDSLGPHGVRLTTMEVTFPRIVLADFSTHRVFSKNGSSSRAIPAAKQIERVLNDPFVPIFKKNQKGMQPGVELDSDAQAVAEHQWLCARWEAVEYARSLDALGVHKQWVNRLIEPFSWQTMLVSSTEWANFFAQRCHPDAQEELQVVARLMRSALQESTPKSLKTGEWHLPYSDPERDQDVPRWLWPQLSAGRCARVSYLTHDGKRDPQADLDLFSRLANSEPPHWSPMEHAAQALALPVRERNFIGWQQLRVLEGG